MGKQPATPTNDLLLRAARRQRTERTPVWLMRQAGRADPLYRNARRRADLSLEAAFRDADLCAELSLLPRRIGVDAIIHFQDILTPLAPMGAEFIFRPEPVLATPIRTIADIEALTPIDPSTSLAFIERTLRLIRRSLAGELPVLGFAGAPFTLAAFLIEGRSPGPKPARTHDTSRERKASGSRSGFASSHTRDLIQREPAAFHRLLDKLADMTADYLAFQIEAGADAVQLFESFADGLSESQYREFAHPYHVAIFSKLARRVPTILFVREQPFVELMAESGADVLSIGTCVDLADAKRRVGHQVAFQGNVDNRLLVSGAPAEIDAAVRACVQAGGHEGHILNLSHGLLKETPWENVCRFVAAARASERVESVVRTNT